MSCDEVYKPIIKRKIKTKTIPQTPSTEIIPSTSRSNQTYASVAKNQSNN